MLGLALKQRASRCAKCALRVQIGTVASRIREALPSGTALLHGSRTPVTRFSNYWTYRFFPVPSAKYRNALAPQRNHVVAAPPLPVLLPGIPCTELLTITSRGHSSNAANCSGSGMLLPLCGIARLGRLCEVVRFEPLCLSLESDEVRETTHANAGQ